MGAWAGKDTARPLFERELMKYVRVPQELRSTDIRAEEFRFSPGRYVRFLPPAQRDKSHYLPLDQLVVVREEVVKADKGEMYRYAEIGDIDVGTGGVTFREMPGFKLPTLRPSRAVYGDVLISTVRTYRKGIGLVTNTSENLVTTNAILNFCATTGVAPNVTLPYIFAFLRSDFFGEQVWSLLNRGVYPRMDAGALDKIILPVSDDVSACEYVSALALAISEKERAIRVLHRIGLKFIGEEIAAGQTEPFDYHQPTVNEMRSAGRMDAGFWSRPLREQLHQLALYRRGSWSSIYAAGYTTRRGPNLAVSVSGPAYYSDRPFGNALPMATPGDISDFMTIPRFRYYGNPRRIDTVRQSEIMFAAKGVREVSIGHTWVNLGTTPFITNFDSFLIHSAERTRSIFLAFLLSYLKSVGVFAKLSDTSNGGSFVQSHFHALPVPKFPDSLQEQIARLYHRSAAPPPRKLTLENFVAWHRDWNESLGIWELDREMKALQQTLAAVQEQIIEGCTVKLPFS
jgi:hypothetical protein